MPAPQFVIMHRPEPGAEGADGTAASGTGDNQGNSTDTSNNPTGAAG